MKGFIKGLVFLAAALVALPFTFSFKLLSIVAGRDGLITSYSQLLSLIPGKLGAYVRAGFYRFTITSCDKNAFISFGVLFSQIDTEIASGVYIGPQCNIGKCSIGEDTLLGSAVHIMSGKQQHTFDDINTPIRKQGGIFEKVTIGQNCWLGNGALIMANVGDNCIVAAGSVVINDIEPKSIVAGNPAKVIKKR